MPMNVKIKKKEDNARVRTINFLVAGPDENLGLVNTWGQELFSLRERLGLFVWHSEELRGLTLGCWEFSKLFS